MKRRKWLVIVVAMLPFCIGAPVDAQKIRPSFGMVTAIHATDEDAAVKVDLVTVEELKAMIAKNQVTIIDVRSSDSFAESDNEIKGSIHFRLRRLASRVHFPPLKDLPRDRELVTYCSCADDKASIRAAQILKDKGFKRVRALRGGWTAWVNARGPMQPRPK